MAILVPAVNQRGFILGSSQNLEFGCLCMPTIMILPRLILPSITSDQSLKADYSGFVVRPLHHDAVPTYVYFWSFSATHTILVAECGQSILHGNFRGGVGWFLEQINCFEMKILWFLQELWKWRITPCLPHSHYKGFCYTNTEQCECVPTYI